MQTHVDGLVRRMSCGDCNVDIAIHVALKVAIVTLCVPPLSPLPQSSSSCSATKSPRCPISNARSAPQPSSPSSANSNCSIPCPAIPIGVVSTPSLPSPVLMPRAFGPSKTSGSHVTEPCWPPPRPLSANRHAVILPRNSPLPCIPKCRTRSVSSCSAASSTAPSWAACISTPVRSQPSIANKSWRARPRNWCPVSPTPRSSSALPRNSRRPSFCSTACSMNNNAASTPAWSRSVWDAEAIPVWPHCSGWMCTRSPAVASNYWSSRPSPAASVSLEADVSRRKKNVRNPEADRTAFGARHGRRPHRRSEVDPQNYGQDRGPTEPLADSGQPPHGCPAPPQAPLFAPCQPQEGGTPTPPARGAVRPHRQTASVFPPTGESGDQRRRQEERNGGQLQERWRQVGSHPN